MGALTFGNADKQETNTSNNQIYPTVTGDSNLTTVQRGRQGNNTGNVLLRLGRNSTYTVNNGLGAEQFDAFNQRLTDAISNINRQQDASTSERVATSERIADNVQQGSPSIANKLGIGNIILIAAGLVALAFVAIHKRVKKKA